MQAPEPIRILVVDDQPLFRRAIASLIDVQDDLTVVGAAENGLEAVEMAHELVPDIVVMDVEMPVMDGVEATHLIREQLPSIKVVMLTVSESEDHLFDAIRFGAHAYLLKDLRPEELYDRLRAVMRGEAPISSAIAGRLLEAFRDGESPRLASPRLGRRRPATRPRPNRRSPAASSRSCGWWRTD